MFVYSLTDVQSMNNPLRSWQQIQFGISYISAFLKKYNHNTKLVVLSKFFGGRNSLIIDKSIKEFSPKLVCFTSTSSEYDFIRKIGEYIGKNYPNIYLVIGGCHASLNPNEVIQGQFDALCVGEGEYPIFELVSQLESGFCPSKILNLWIKNSTGIEKNPPRPFIYDLDNLPFADRDIWQPWIAEQLDGGNSVLLGRGCPFDCTYCCNHSLRKISQGSYVRLRSPENITEEIHSLISTFSASKEIFLEVESFGLDKAWAFKLCSQLEQLNRRLDEPLSFSVNLRITPNMELESFFAVLKKANFKVVNIGLESGSEKIRRDILKRNYKNEDIISACALARKHGIKVALFNMIGIPGETIEDFKETVKVNRACFADYDYTGIFYPYPGTELYSLCKTKGFLERNLKTKMERSEAVLEFPDFSRKQIYWSYLWFDYYIYRGRKPLYKILLNVLLRYIKSVPSLYLIFRKFVQLPLLRNMRLAFIES